MYTVFVKEIVQVLFDSQDVGLSIIKHTDIFVVYVMLELNSEIILYI